MWVFVKFNPEFALLSKEACFAPQWATADRLDEPQF
jgi:hypothetical protein